MGREWNREVKRLRHLVARVCDGCLDEGEQVELNGLLLRREELRREYLVLMDLHLELARRGEIGEGSFGTGKLVCSARTVPLGMFLGSLAAAACLVVGLFLRGVEAEVERVPVATVGYAAGVEWSLDGTVEVGEWMPGGVVRLEAGDLGLVFVNGAEVSLRGPAVFSIESEFDLIVEEGEVAAVVPESASGFTVRNEELALVDIGTSFSMSVRRGGMGEIVVHDGEVVASLLGADGATLRDFSAVEGERVLIDAGRGEIGDGGGAIDFRPLPMAPMPLRVTGGYVGLVQGDGPVGYWRFEEVVDGRVENSVAGGAALEVTGELELAGPAGFRAGVFPGGGETPVVELAEALEGLNGEDGYSLELWFYAGSRQFATLLGVYCDELEREREPAYLSVLEQTAGANSAGGIVHGANRLRFLHRVPPAGRGGYNAFSESEIEPRRWYHLVAVQDRERLRVYLNGELEREVAQDSAVDGERYRLVVGNLRPSSWPSQRAFAGRIDEVAVYRRALRKDEVRAHYRAVESAP